GGDGSLGPSDPQPEPANSISAATSAAILPGCAIPRTPTRGAAAQPHAIGEEASPGGVPFSSFLPLFRLWAQKGRLLGSNRRFPAAGRGPGPSQSGRFAAGA